MASVVAVVATTIEPAAAAAAPVIAADDLVDANTSSIAVSNNNAAAGDLLIVHIVRDSTDAVTPPTGWTHLRSDNLTFSYQSIHYRVADGTEAASDTWGFTGAAADTVIYSARITGADPTTPIADHSATITTSANDMIAPSVTVTNTDSLLLALYDGDSGNAGYNPPTGMTETADRKRGFVALYAAAETITTAGTTGTRTATPTSPVAHESIGAALVVNPAGVATTSIGVAVDDVAVASRDTPAVIDPTTNDTDTETEPVDEIAFTQPASGAVSDNGDGTLTYTPDPGYTGPDSFDYWAIDSGANLVHYWGLNGTATDSVGTSHGITTGTTTVAGDFDQATSFDETDDHIAVPDFAYGTDYTISFEFKIDDNSGSLFQYLYSHGDINGFDSVNVFVNEAGHGSDPNVLRTVARDSDDTLDNIALQTNIAALVGDGQWHTYTLTASSTGGLVVYIDGVVTGTDATRGTSTTDPSASLILGGRHDLDADRFYGGALDTVQVYDRALSATEVADLDANVNIATVSMSVTAPTPVVFDSTQKGTATLTGGLSSTSATITAVDTTKSFLVFNVRENINTPVDGAVTGRLASPTSVVFERNGTAGTVTIEWSVVSFTSGVTVQRGTTALGAATTNVPIAAVDLTKSFPTSSMRVSGLEFSHDDLVRARLTSSTNLELTLETYQGNNNVVDWQVIQYGDATVQSGLVSFGSGDLSRSATVSAVDTAQSWLVSSYSGAYSVLSNIGERLVSSEVTNATTLTFDRSVSGSTVDLAWYLVEFDDATAVQQGTEPFVLSDTTNDVTITSVDPASSIAVGGHQMTGGRSPYGSDDVPGVAWFTYDLTSSTNLRIQRDSTAATAAAPWTVVSWSADTATVNSSDDDADSAIGDGVCDTGGLNAEGDRECTLRAAIAEANASAALDRIEFDIPVSDSGYNAVDGYWRIRPATALPSINAATSVDGSTQPGSNASSTTAPAPVNSSLKIELSGASLAAADHGLQLEAGSDGSEIRGIAFTGATGTSGHALFIDNSSNNLVVGNHFGASPDGLTQIGNRTGVAVTGTAVGNRIGGTLPADRNLFAHQTYAHVEIAGSAVTGTFVEGNDMGYLSGGAGATSGPTFGIVLWSGTSGNLIGGDTAAAANRIRNSWKAVLVDDNAGPAHAAVIGNHIENQAGSGLDLLNDGHTPNDADDTDIGPNDWLNHPEITDAVESAGTVTVNFDLDVPAGDYRVEVFTSPSGGHPSGYGAGELYENASAITHTGSGLESFQLTYDGASGDIVTLTATSQAAGPVYLATSEFSATAAVAQGDFVVNSTTDRADTAHGDGNCDTGFVNTQGDPECTLRAAIEEANDRAGADTIVFSIPTTEGGHAGGVWTIAPGTPFENLNETTTLDATTQAGYGPTPVVELDGSGAGAGADGLRVNSDNSEIRGLAIGRFLGDGIEVMSGAADTAIAANHIGVDSTGLVDRGNDRGIDLSSGSGPTTVGGPSPSDGNLLSGNARQGITIWDSDANVVTNNLIGTDVTGNSPLPNDDDGIGIGISDDNIIGQAGRGNVLSGNGEDGIEVSGLNARTIIQANTIGLGLDGATPVANGRHGVVLYTAPT